LISVYIKRKEMVFCSNCGTSLSATAKFCPNCGTKVEAPAPAPATPPRGSVCAQAEANGGYSAGELRGVTNAVRDYSNNASQAEKEKKYGQQKWGLFETDYQRRKGITTEQSLQEIEAFCDGGGEVCAPHPSARPGDGPFGGTADGTFYPSTGGYNNGLSPRKFGPGGSSGGYSTTTTTTHTAGYSTGVGGSGDIHFADEGNAGAAFFAQHQAREAAKYKPGYRGPK